AELLNSGNGWNNWFKVMPPASWVIPNDSSKLKSGWRYHIERETDLRCVFVRTSPTNLRLRR
ncbi:MAG TPA: hypothetical protein VFS84_07075, partial [Candidatus Binatia bacterium]|nr:hypothetical protein [Candidatus Binatia bacterium]